ncbi:hypothetical protein BCR32DRAFT_281603 [Anaeromyces robustus]|uniref:C2 domain-containing protein n=1 Tax=Anaeromyces robustus TaxID=1754192 RepID=A0A1Y1X1D4_9FUNG|nr:hypothetical protein BCR32DRAFT_281603 [Anaeromyces robustus]|eukprot:ORX79226.1 hypothetical protein BCR32DRAFT_281603 [Anaeromyces robustus]
MPTNLILHIIEAKDLLVNDSNGLSDPYVVIPDKQPGISNIPKKGLKTQIIKKTLNPVWNKQFNLNCDLEKNSDIKIEVYDDNFITKDVLIGECILNLEWMCCCKIKFHEEWIDLYVYKKDKQTKRKEKKMKGKIHIKIEVPPQPLTYPNQNIETNYILQPGNWIPILEDIVNVGLGWDFTEEERFDLDASVTAFNYNLDPITSIYYNNLSGLNKSVLHHGDNLTGEGDGDDEVITIGLDRVPDNVKLLAVTINSYRENSIIKAKSGFIRLYTNTTGIGKYILSRSKDCIGLLLGLFERDNSNNRWFFQVMIDPIEGNVVTKSYDSMKVLLKAYDKNFIEETINNYIPIHPIPNEIIFEYNSWIPVTSQLTFIGLGWDIKKGMIYDLDASIIIFDMNNNISETIYHKNMKSVDGTIYHYGDNKTGNGDGDDEIISINFPELNSNIGSMAVILNSFKGTPLTGIKGGFIRLFNEKGPIGCHLLNESRECTGLLLGLFRKDVNTGNWFFHVMVDNINGIYAKESIPDVINLLNNYIYNPK